MSEEWSEWTDVLERPADVVRLRLWDPEMADLSAVALCVNLKELDLHSTGRAYDARPKLRRIDLSPLASCAGLQSLVIDDCLVDDDESSMRRIDLSPLASCVNLQVVVLSRMTLQSIDLSPLASCTGLQRLELSGLTALRSVDLSPLASCANLQSLTVSDLDNLLSIDLSPLVSCTNLQSLTVSDLDNLSSIDLSPLASCIRLQSLRVAGLIALQSIDLSPLASCVSLRRLILDGCGRWFHRDFCIDLSPLASCVNLRELVLSWEQTFPSMDLSPLASCLSLQEFRLSMYGEEVIDLAPLSWCTRLTKLGDEPAIEGRSSPLRLATALLYGDSPVAQDPKFFSDSRYQENPLDDWPDIRRFVDKARPSAQLSNFILLKLGLEDLGLIDSDLFPVFKSVPATASLDEARRAVTEAIIPYICRQIDRGGTTLGLTTESIMEHADIATRAARITELRRLELERTILPIFARGEVELEALWFTAYGFQILTALKAGLRCLRTELEPVRSALSSIGVELKTAEQTKEAPVTNLDSAMSDDLRHYILKCVHWRHTPGEQKH